MQQGAIPVGSYIIRCVHGGPEFTGGRRGVLHRKTRSNKLIVAERDEEAEREDQTFWIEPIPEFQYDEKETNLIYHITHLSSGEVVEVPNGSHDSEQPLKTWIKNGTPSQMWRFIRLDDSKDDGEYYNIVNVQSGLGVDFTAASGVVQCHQQKANGNQIFQLIIPVTSIPCGWHQLKNVSSGHILSHSYLTSPPQLIAQTKPPKHSSNYRETWGTQWAVIRSSVLDSSYTKKTSYFIKNRLTGGYIMLKAGEFPKEQVQGCIKAFGPWAACNFELDNERNWQIVDERSGELLGEAFMQTALGGDMAVANSKKSDPRRSWKFVQMQDVDAMLENVVKKKDEPPEYEDPDD